LEKIPAWRRLFLRRKIEAAGKTNNKWKTHEHADEFLNTSAQKFP
jgi:hypothetical protein